MGWRESCEHLLHYLGALPCCSRCPRLYLYPTGVISCEQMNFRHVGLQGSCKENMKQQNLPAETYIAEVVGPKLVWNVLPAKVRQAIASVKADYGNHSAASGSGSSMAPHISGSSEATPPRKVQELAHACRTRSKETVNLFMLCLGEGKSTKRWNYETQHNTGHHKSKTCTREHNVWNTFCICFCSGRCSGHCALSQPGPSLPSPKGLQRLDDRPPGIG